MEKTSEGKIIMKKEYEKLFTSLSELGVDTDGTISRFVGNEDIYVKFLTGYIAEERMPDIYAALAEKNTDELIMKTHKLKGVSGNLGMTEIYELAEKAISLLRSGTYEGVEELLKRTEDIYNRICDAIRQNKP